MDYGTSTIGLGIVAVIGLIGVIVLAGTAVGAATGEPTATIKYEPSSPTVDEAVTFVANASDPDGTVTKFEWTIDGTTVARSQRFNYTFESAGDHQVRLRVTDDDGNATTTSTVVTVQATEPPTASIEFSPPSPSPGEAVSLQANAEDPDGTIDTYQWRIDGEVVTGERTDPTFQFAFKTTGDHLVSVVVTDDDGATTTANTTVSVTEKTAANFSIAGVSTTSPVVEGDRLTVTARIENVGALPGNQTVTLSVAGEVSDSRKVTLGGGENRTITLAWETTEGNSGDHSVSVTTDNGSATRLVQVLEPATFTVDIDSTNSPVTIGDRDAHNLEINATVKNVGDQPGNQTVTLAVGTVQRDVMAVALDAGESRRLTFRWPVEEGDAGTYTARVATGNDSVRTDVRVNEPSSADLSIDETDAPVEAGSPMRFTVSVENPGSAVISERVSLAVNGTEQDATTVSLGGGENETITLTWATGTGDAGEYTAVVSSPNATVRGSVTVIEENSAPSVGAIGFVPCDSDCEGDPVFASSNDSDMAQEELTISYDKYKRVRLVAPDANDSDGSVESYEWVVDGDPAGTGAELTQSFESAGQHDVRVTVTDDDGARTERGVTVHLNKPPIAEISLSSEHPAPDEPIRVTAEASDPDGDDDALQYEWDFGDGTTASGSGASYPYDVPGNKTITLSVTDSDGGTTTVERTLHVNEPPEVSVTVPQNTVVSGEPTTLEGSTTDPDGDDEELAYEWRVDGEPAGSGASLKYRFEEPGEHEVILRVVDEQGAETTVTRTLEVENSAGESAATTERPQAAGNGGLVDGLPADDPLLFGIPAGLLLLALFGYVYANSSGSNGGSSQNAPSRPGRGGAASSGDGDEGDYNETETIIDPEPGGASDSGDGGHTQHDEFDSEDKMNEDSGAGMDPSDSAFPPFTSTEPNGATDSGDADDEDYNETETIIDPEPGGASDSGGDAGGSPAGESSEDVTGSGADDGVTDEHTATIDWRDGDEPESTGDGGHTQHDEFDSEDKMNEDSRDGDG